MKYVSLFSGIEAATVAMELARDCMREDEERRQDVTVTIPPVRCFAGVAPDKAQALKPLEEAAEVFGAWQRLLGNRICDGYGSVLERCARAGLVDECCDVITATCNLLAALGVTDLTDAMERCEERNERRGRYE